MAFVPVGERVVSVSVVMPECTKEEFRNGVVSGARKDPRVVDWVNSYTPVLDVTQKTRNVYSDVIKAFLAIYGDNLNAIRTQGPYTSLPSPLPDSQIIYNWRVLGEEWERQRCPKNNRYYWVIYPAKFIAFKDFTASPSKTTIIQGETITLVVKVPYMLTKGKTATLDVVVSPDWASAITRTQSLTGTGEWSQATVNVPISFPSTVSPGSHSIGVAIRIDLGG